VKNVVRAAGSETYPPPSRTDVRFGTVSCGPLTSRWGSDTLCAVSPIGRHEPHAQIRRMGCASQPIPNAASPSRTKPRPGSTGNGQDDLRIPTRPCDNKLRPRLAYLGKKTYATCCGCTSQGALSIPTGWGAFPYRLCILKRLPAAHALRPGCDRQVRHGNRCAHHVGAPWSGNVHGSA